MVPFHDLAIAPFSKIPGNKNIFHYTLEQTLKNRKYYTIAFAKQD
jgi:hypothetical protein